MKDKKINKRMEISKKKGGKHIEAKRKEGERIKAKRKVWNIQNEKKEDKL